MEISPDVRTLSQGIERNLTNPKPDKKVSMKKDSPIIVEISKANYLSSENKIENVFEAVNLLKEIGTFIVNNKEEALNAQGNLQENRVNDLLNLT